MIKPQKSIVINSVPHYQFKISSFFQPQPCLATFGTLNFSPLPCTQLLVSPQVSNATCPALLTQSTCGALLMPPAHF